MSQTTLESVDIKYGFLKKSEEELLNREYPPVWSDFSMEVVDKTILMSDFGFPNKKK